MLVFIIIALIISFICVPVFKTIESETCMIISCMVFWVCAVLAVIGLTEKINSNVVAVPMEESIVSSNMPIQSAKLDNTIAGSFFIGCGRIYEEPTYYFYIKDDDGRYSLKSITGNNIFIAEDVASNDDAYLETIKYTQSKYVYKHPYLMGKKYKINDINKVCNYIIHVPEGTIVKSLDGLNL